MPLRHEKNRRNQRNVSYLKYVTHHIHCISWCIFSHKYSQILRIFLIPRIIQHKDNMHVEDKNTIHCIDIVWIITCLHQVLVRTSQLCIMYTVPRTLWTTTNKLCILHSPSWWGYYGPLLSGVDWSGKHVTNRYNHYVLDAGVKYN